MAPLRTLFFGTAELAAVSLTRLVADSSVNLLGVVTQPDKPRGRDLKLQPSPVKGVALSHGLPVWQPTRCREPAFLELLRAQAPELIVVAAYGQILPPALLELPRYGCLNVHASLLPLYRGAAPIQWAILDGQRETGITLMKMDAGLDTGAIVSVVTTPILAEDNAGTLHDRLAREGAELLVRSLPGYIDGQLPPRPQPSEGASYARKITKDDGHIDWTLPALTVGNRIRAFTPWPGAYSHLSGAAEPRALRLKIWRAEPTAAGPGASSGPGTIVEAAKERLVVACGSGGLRVLELQREGGRRLAVAEFLTGCPLPIGARLG